MTENLNLLQREGESNSAYHRRLIYGKLVDKTLSDADYSEIAELVYGRPYSSDVARRMLYGSRNTIQLYEDEAANTALSASGEAAASIEANLRELRKERYKLQAEKAEYNKWVKSEAHFKLFEEKVIQAIAEHAPVMRPPEAVEVKSGSKGAVLCLADAHFGKEYKVYGLRQEVINEYSPEIFFSRMEQVYSETLEMMDRDGLTELHVFNLGDSVDGFLRNSQAWTLRYGAIDSAIIYGCYMGDWLRKLSEHIRVVYSQVDGNHDELRVLDGKKGQHLNESAGKIVKNCIKLKNEGNPNFIYNENCTDLIYDTVCGFNLLGVHFGGNSPKEAIREFSNIYGTDINYLFTGHFHTAEFTTAGSKAGCIGVGSIMGVDEFAMKIRRRSDATCTLAIFEEGKGKVDEHTYYLG